MNKILLAGAMLFAGASMMAQETVTEYTYNPNWYIQGQFGGQETLGESSFGHLFNPNAQITVGYNFTPSFGLRLAVNGWQSRGAIDFTPYGGATQYYNWKYNYVAPTLDAVINLSNLIGGYKPDRLIDLNLIAGVGANIAFNNDDAVKASAALVSQDAAPLELLWDGTKARFVGQFGLGLDFNVSEHVAVGLEVMANVLPDGYNSKRAANADWYFNGLVGVKYTFGKKYTATTRTIEVPVAEPQIVERIIERVIEAPAPAPTNALEEVKAEILRRDVFFRINTASISKDEMNKVTEVADYLKSHPNAKVEITGYADKGTGTMAVNLRLSKQRAQIVANTLKNKYGIPADRMVVKSMGEEAFQPYSDPVDNRVAICVCE